MRLGNQVPDGHGNYPVESGRSRLMERWDEAWYRDWLERRKQPEQAA